MRRSILNYSLLILLLLCLSASLFLVSCGEEEMREQENSDVVTDEFTNDDPTIDAPTEDKPAVDEPTVNEPVIDDPTEDEPDTDVPTVDEPITDEPTVDLPTTDEPVVDEPTKDVPTEDDSADEPEIPDGTDKPDDSVTVMPEPEVKPVYPENIGGSTSTPENEQIDVTASVANGLKSSVSIYSEFSCVTSYPWGGTPVTTEYASTGSGVIYSLTDDGSAFIITNYHVVYDEYCDTENHISDSINVYLYGMESTVYAIPATYVGGSANYDIAVLRVDKSEVLDSAIDRGVVKPAKVADSDMLYPGDRTIAIGNPTSETVSGLSVTMGIVSIDSEYIQLSLVDGSGTASFRVIRTDTALNSGNSGGGLFNARGELIGIVNSKTSNNNLECVGYAIPTNVAIAVANNIIDNCYEKENEKVFRAVLGIDSGVTELITNYDVESGRIIKTETVIITEIAEGGLAEGHLMAGDVIKAIRIGENGVDVTRAHKYIDFLLNARIGDVVTIDVLRSGVLVSVNLTITEDSVKAV